MSDANQTWIDQCEEFELVLEKESFQELNLNNNTKMPVKHISFIHGIKYITSNRTNWRTKIFWTLTMIVSGVIFATLTFNLFKQWSDSPIMINVVENPKSISELPFPAITICPEIKMKLKLFNFTRIYNEIISNGGVFDDLTNDQIKNLKAISQICDPHITESFPFNQSEIGENMYNDLKQLAPTMKEVLFFCKRHNKPDSCVNFFSEIWTDEGLCFTYNILNSADMFKTDINFPPVIHNHTSANWNIETGFEKTSNNDPATTYPHRVHGSGLRGGLNVLLRLYDYDFDYMCRGPVLGYKLWLHSPNDLPQISKHFIRVPLNQETRIIVKPIVTFTSKQLISYNWKLRKCFVGSEKILKYFNEYSQTNCEIECLSDYIIEKCGCAKFAMPKNKSTPICGASNIQCYHDAEDELIAKDHLDGISNDKTDCNCLPSCTSIKYDVEITHSEFNLDNLFKAFNQPLDEDHGMKCSRLSIIFKDNHYTPTSRYILQSNTEMLALFGGLLALFFGASFLSFIEILYCIVENFLNSKCNFEKFHINSKL